MPKASHAQFAQYDVLPLRTRYSVGTAEKWVRHPDGPRTGSERDDARCGQFNDGLLYFVGIAA